MTAQIHDGSVASCCYLFRYICPTNSSLSSSQNNKIKYKIRSSVLDITHKKEGVFEGMTSMLAFSRNFHNHI